MLQSAVCGTSLAQIRVTGEKKAWPGLPGRPEAELGFCVLEKYLWPLLWTVHPFMERCRSPGWKTAKHPWPLQPKIQRQARCGNNQCFRHYLEGFQTLLLSLGRLPVPSSVVLEVSHPLVFTQGSFALWKSPSSTRLLLLSLQCGAAAISSTGPPTRHWYAASLVGFSNPPSSTDHLSQSSSHSEVLKAQLLSPVRASVFQGILLGSWISHELGHMAHGKQTLPFLPRPSVSGCW